VWQGAEPELVSEDDWPPRRYGNERTVWKVLSRSDTSGQGGLSLPKKAADTCLPALVSTTLYCTVTYCSVLLCSRGFTVAGALL